jgi:CheY-like chemotaxis protein
MIHTVLVVEDEDDLRESMQEALTLNGYTVVAAHDGQEAIAALGSIEHCCLVLLDLVMPVMDGWTFYAQMQARPAFAAIPVVVHTSAPGGAPTGVARVVRKPLELAGLLSLVREFCEA